MLSHAADRVAALRTELKITEAQTPAWNKFADALVAGLEVNGNFNGSHAAGASQAFPKSSNTMRRSQPDILRTSRRLRPRSIRSTLPSATNRKKLTDGFELVRAM
jgi:hypothetical protein